MKHVLKKKNNTGMESMVSFNVFLVFMIFTCPVVNSSLQCLKSATSWHILSPCYLLYNSTISNCYHIHYTSRKESKEFKNDIT